ncbi:MAG: hypothetical protein KF805_12440, partial [Phycisphaeraceae bacterium]|nr:hypothetical protein [Phycisphaeraceae bacterium]
MNRKLHGWQSAFVAVMAGGVIGEAFRSFSEKIRGVAEEMDKLAKRAKETQTPIEQLSQIEFAGKLSGVENVSTLLNFLAKNLGMAADGNKELAESFQRLGVDASEFVKSGVPAANLMGFLIDRLKAMPQASAAFLSTQIFGRGGFDVMKFGSGAEFNDSLSIARRSGATVTEEQAKAAERFNDEMTRLGEQIASGWRAVLLPLFDPLREIISGLEVVSGFYSDLLKAGATGARSIVPNDSISPGTISTITNFLAN